MQPPPPISSLFPYTTLFRSLPPLHQFAVVLRPAVPRNHNAGSEKHCQLNILNERSEEHTSELQSRGHFVCRLLLAKKNTSGSIFVNIQDCINRYLVVAANSV